ncbi:hypothetical protein A8B78_10585 [Jannaschia sp. EhC01]|nr:hypothetical protein A8B78_10585 [Jannaschia sp. EhC01]
MRFLPAKFLLLPATQCIAIAGMILGGGYTFLGFGVVVLLALVLDRFDDHSDYDDRLDVGISGKALVYLIVALQAVLIVTSLMAATSAHSWLGVVGVILTLGQLLGLGAVDVGHELAHSRNRLDVEIGRAVIAPCLHTSSIIDHVYRHHAAVCTADDAVSAKRGEPFVAYFRRSVVSQNLWAWEFAAKRMRHLGKSVWSLSNAALRGHILEVAYLLFAALVFGWVGLLVAVVAALIAMRAIESISYIAHYGLIRVPGTPCCSRHSWNSRRTISSGYMLNMTSHSHHHTTPSLPYWDLRVKDDMPILPLSPGIMSLIAPISPLWFRAIEPAIEDWDRRFATDAERALLAEQTWRRPSRQGRSTGGLASGA